MSQPFLGQIYGFGLSYAVQSFAFCAGQLIAVSSNQSLFSLLGTIYGGDGRTTFGLPDLRGRISFQSGQGTGLPAYRIGAKGGATQITQTRNQLASHNHPRGTIGARAAVGTVIAPDPTSVLSVPVAPSGNVTAYAPSIAANATLSAEGGETASAGGGLSMNIENPYLAISYEIAISGFYPSRQ